MVFTLSKGAMQGLNLTYTLYQPPDLLKPYIKFFWTFDSKTGFHSGFERFLPDGCVELVFNYKTCPKLFIDQSEETLPISFIHGQIKKPIRLMAVNGIGMVGARFYPFGVRRFVKHPVSELNNRAIPTHHILGETKEIEESIDKGTPIESKVNALSSFLIARLLPHVKPDYLVQDCANKIIQSHGNIDVADLRKKVRISDRHLERRFSEIIGIAPKTLQRIIRFQNILSLVHQNKFSNLGALSLDLGYYDQAHFTKDFKQFSGLCPQKFFSDCHPLFSLLPDGSKNLL